MIHVNVGQCLANNTYSRNRGGYGYELVFVNILGPLEPCSMYLSSDHLCRILLSFSHKPFLMSSEFL